MRVGREGEKAGQGADQNKRSKREGEGGKGAVGQGGVMETRNQGRARR